MVNQVTILMQNRSANESFARTAAAAFIAPFDPTVEVLNDVKTAVSEAVTNAIIHGYDGAAEGTEQIRMSLAIDGNELTVEVSDTGVGMTEIPKALEPMYTTKPDLERSGMGFTVIDSLMDTLGLESRRGEGTTVTMTKKLS